MGKNQKKLTVDELIQKTVNAAVIAQRIASDSTAKDAFKATEKRLYAYPVIQLRIVDTKEKMEEIKTYGVHGKSKSITRFVKNGMRLTEDEIQEGILQDLTVNIAMDEREIETIKKAVEIIASDQYADVVKYKYFEGRNDEQIADIMHCDPSTVRRNKSRLVGRLSIFLYGANVVL